MAYWYRSCDPGVRIVSGDDTASRNEMLFIQVVSMFQIAALQHMGKLPNPVTNKVERDLEQARISVDILGMLKEKTKGNLSENEEEFLGKVVFESQMNYLDELKKPEGREKGSSDATGGVEGERAEPTEKGTDDPTEGDSAPSGPEEPNRKD